VRIVAVAAASAAFAVSAAVAQDEAAFDQGIAAVHAAMQQGKWPDARAALLQLLEQHKERLYVLAQKDAIVADCELCSFWCQAAVPKVQDLLSGRIDAYSPGSSHLKIRYQRDNMADWEQGDTLWVHPLVFAGSYTITINDAHYPADNSSLRVVFDLDDASYYVADFGFPPFDQGRTRVWLPPSIQRVEGKQRTEIDKRDTSAAKPGQPFTAQVRVTKASVEMVYDRKSVLKGKRVRGDSFGQVALFPGSFEEVTLEGDIEPSWLQGLIDQKLAGMRAEFTGRFRAQEVLPKWLFVAPKVERTLPKEDDLASCARSAQGRAVLAQLVRGEFDAALQRLGELGDDDFEAGHRTLLIGLCNYRRGDAEAAQAAAAQALAALPSSTHARVLQAEVWIALHRSGEALALLRQAVADDPGDHEATTALFTALMRDGRVDDAARLVRDAKCRHGLWEEMRELDTMLAMRRRGPAWPKRFSYQTQHYVVYSDIDRKVCAEATRLLENAYVNLEGQLGWLVAAPAAAGQQAAGPQVGGQQFERFEVYLFAGESGYQEYNKHILGSAVPHTAGLYSPVLKQLLIWNLPKREDMARTIQHEGFHQYLDRAMDDPPVWFNEGMAEFWETAQRENGALQGGQVRKDHIATILRGKQQLLPLREFVYGSRADFYRFAQLRYAQGWALVHFLRKGPPQNQKLFKALWDALRQRDLGTRAALDRAFAGVDWQKFEADFWAYVGTLASQK
jgi:tetratricopeptide (TPR) repeat protein